MIEKNGDKMSCERKIFLLLVLILGFVFTSCSSEPLAEIPTITPKPTSTLPTATASANKPLENCLTIQNNTSSCSNQPLADIPTITPKPTSTPLATIASENEPLENCPIVQNDASNPLFVEGSLIFHVGKIPDEYQTHEIFTNPQIWAMSTNLVPKIILENSIAHSISSDGQLLLARQYANDESELVFYDLESKSLVPYDGYLFLQRWFDGGPQYGNVVEKIEGIGIKQEVIYPISDTQSTEKIIEEYNLPEYAFSDAEIDRGIFYGYESIDPLGEVVLYTAKVSDDHHDFEVRLLDLKTGRILWQHDTYFLPTSLPPQWSSDGASVSFIVSDAPTESNSNWWKIVQISRTGELIDLPSQPFPGTEGGDFNHFSISPNRRYLFYTAVNWDENFNIFQRAFIVDINSGMTGEICDSESKFIASIPVRNGEIEGLWLSDEQFVYRVLIEKEGQLTHSLRILDIPSWASQILFEPEPGDGVYVVGWSPLEIR